MGKCFEECSTCYSTTNIWITPKHIFILLPFFHTAKHYSLYIRKESLLYLGASLQSMAEPEEISRVQGKNWGVHGVHNSFSQVHQSRPGWKTCMGSQLRFPLSQCVAPPRYYALQTGLGGIDFKNIF